MQDWWTHTGASHLGALHGDDLVETCSYIQLAALLGIDERGQRDQLEANLDPGAPPSDPQLAEMLAEAWSTLHGDPARLDPLRREITRHQLPNGLIPAVQTQLGDLQASQQVETLRSLADLPTLDPKLADALRAHRSDLGRSGPGASATWLSVLTAATGGTQDTTDPHLRSRAITDLPSTLSVDTAQSWAGMVSALETLHLPVPAVRVASWPADTPEHRYLRYLAIADLAETGQLAALRAPGTPNELAAQGIDLLAGGSLHQAAAALTAAAALHWHPTRSDRDRLLTLLRPLQGCPGTPALFRDNRLAQTCDVYSTTSAWHIYRTLGVTSGT
ncbi:hypothetical protein ABIA33_004988 [Streptacidiphilus sp. MAP12-16]|uniref:hypothetical protein n=1 Tax=Streptacidiphilus sp. MAP12-16 TaxID=3156300 RepID=UPI0035156C52